MLCEQCGAREATSHGAILDFDMAAPVTRATDGSVIENLSVQSTHHLCAQCASVANPPERRARGIVAWLASLFRGQR